MVSRSAHNAYGFRVSRMAVEAMVLWPSNQASPFTKATNVGEFRKRSGVRLAEGFPIGPSFAFSSVEPFDEVVDEVEVGEVSFEVDGPEVESVWEIEICLLAAPYIEGA